MLREGILMRLMRFGNMALSAAALMIIALVVLSSGCTSGKAQPAPSATPSVNEITREFSITAKQFEFIPNEIVVNKGERVILHIKSVDVTHGFSIIDYDINEQLNPGQEVTVNFVADKAGEFTFFCSVPCGRGHSSMQGKLVVKQ